MSWSKKQAANRKRKIQLRRQRGLCTNCGAEVNGHALCARCLERKNELQQARRAKRKEAGVCPTCGDPRAEDRNRCQYCYSRKHKANIKYYEKNK
ncbi:MAG: hypothetical protein JRF60_09060 [Deltaproteobacteria bacterium]|nr:hypothetical protein [Deltaproteobacteria bacterium]MBW2250760.1 hypothetical protein [Deltaproteobacteria bacterium]